MSKSHPAHLAKRNQIANSTSLKEILTRSSSSPKNGIENESPNQVTVWAISQTEWRDDVKEEGEGENINQRYEGEYIFHV